MAGPINATIWPQLVKKNKLKNKKILKFNCSPLSFNIFYIGGAQVKIFTITGCDNLLLLILFKDSYIHLQDKHQLHYDRVTRQNF